MKRDDPLYGLAVLRHTPRTVDELTPLNIETTARYEVCAGRHTFSGQVTWRFPRGDVEMKPMPICEKCGVPIPTGYRAWSINRQWEGDDKEAA